MRLIAVVCCTNHLNQNNSAGSEGDGDGNEEIAFRFGFELMNHLF